MNELPDPLELELSALRPRPVSDDLRQRIAECLAEPQPPRPSRTRMLALVGSLTAACFAAVVWWWLGDRAGEKATDDNARVTAIVHVGVGPPTLLAYERALARSPDEFDLLLNRHALATPISSSDPVRVGALMRSDAALHTLLGDD